jgi:SAM-dependent methyltransferase
MAHRAPHISSRPLPPFGYWEYYRELDFLNPTSAEILLKVGRACGISHSTRILDVGSGKGSLAILWAREFGCRVIGVDALPQMVREARRRSAKEHLSDRLVFRQLDALDIDQQLRERFDVVACLGSMFIWGYKEGLQRLLRLVASGGALAYGDIIYTAKPVDSAFLRQAGYEPEEFATEDELHGILSVLGWGIQSMWVSGDREWQHYLQGTGKALDWYNHLHPGIVNPFVEAEREWANSLKNTNRKWVRFIHAVVREKEVIDEHS